MGHTEFTFCMADEIGHISLYRSAPSIWTSAGTVYILVIEVPVREFLR